ncbi:oligomeric, coiled-coil, peripheral membrane protein [Knufia fluminis]|uniref:Autophagy-related protein 11 n=1 Tax=Knufia fluminis TaxID=191047 RepID=A0AAN8ER73_9EURO|nr:oligomeric, coiled-coil, peripheral membrane protein [Knufia fluminis]
MSLNIFLSHSGQRYVVGTDEIPSPDALKQWIASSVDVPVSRQILMTAQGKNVKQQHLVDQSNIFIYDKRFLLGDENAATDYGNDTSISSLSETPAELEDETDLVSWQKLFKSRRAWALEAVDIVKNLSEKSSQLSEACENIDRSTNVALDNLKNHVSSLHSLFEKTQAWAHDTLHEHADMLREWHGMAHTLKELPIRDDIGRLLTPAAAETGQTDVAGTMYTLLDQRALDQANSTLGTSTKAFESQVEDVEQAMDRLNNEADNVSSMVRIEWPSMDAGSLLEEAETLFKKVDGDYNDVLKAASDNRAISKISRVAADHTKSLLPGLQEVVEESIQSFENTRSHKNNLSKICFRALREISKVQSTLAGLQGQVSTLSLTEEGQHSLETLDRVFRLPSVYGSVLIEAIRRSEWNDKTVADLKLFKDELSQHKDDELRRRKKWANSMSGFLSKETATINAMSDFTFSTPSNPWPFVSRDEIFSYIDDLRALEINDAVEQITQGLRDLDSPAKSRRPRPRPFKNGSIHDSMQGSFMRNGDDRRVLQDEKTRLEDKVRASESRIRKLEDLLHRQSQMGRPTSGMFNPITDFSQPPPSPGPESSRPFDPPSRRSSVSVRRMSNQNPDEKVMVQRIVSLEAEVNKLRQEAHAERRASDQHREKMQEAELVKQDLMANFESQRQEFDDERQRLEDDNHELKIRFEELEEELDRVVGSRDHERSKQDQSITHFRSELERLRKTSNQELDQLREVKDALEHDLAAQREKSSHVDQQLHRLREERSNLQTRNMSLANDLKKLEGLQQDLLGTLQSVHEHLSPAGSAPDDPRRLVNALEVLAEGAAFHARGLDDQIQLANAQSKASEEKIEHLETQLQKAHSSKEDQESRLGQKDEQLRQVQHTLETVRKEFEEEKAQVEKLEAKFAAGETGSDALKARLLEEERHVEELTHAKDKSEVQVEVLQQNLRSLREDVDKFEQAQEKLRMRLSAREKKAKALSERLFQHYDRMIRMLENFGWSISKENNSLAIQRTSRINASQILGSEVGIPMKRQISGSLPVQHYTDSNDAQTIYWTSEEDPQAEDARYEAFIAALSKLDLDATVEMITKRYKDVEATARKYHKDARNTREKNHRLNSEAHDKIAYRGFKEGDLALFLPTRNQATRPWAAFNVGAPHYFLREQDTHRLQSRDWLLARINTVEERVVDLSRSMGNASTKANAEASEGDGASLQSIDDNPFELSDGLRWYLIDAVEEKPGAPSTPGLGKSTVAASVIDVKAHMGRRASGGKDFEKATSSAVNAAKTLHKSLDSRRSSEASRKSAGGPPLRTSASNSSAVAPLTTAGTDGEAEGTMSPVVPTIRPSESSLREQGQAREDARLFDVARDRRPALNRAPNSEGSRSIPAKQSTVESPQKQQKPWDRLFSFQYQA